MSDDVTKVEAVDVFEEETVAEKPKRKRRTKAEMEAARAAEKESLPPESKQDEVSHIEKEPLSTEPQQDSASDNAVNSEKPEEGVKEFKAPSIGDDIGSSIWIQNTSRNTIIVPLSLMEREVIFPSRAWNVPLEYVEYVKSWMKTDYFRSMESNKRIKVIDRSPSRLGEADLRKLQTPKPPASLAVGTDEHITQAGFVKQG